MMKLYYFPHACSLADHIVLEWVGVPYQTVRMDLAGTKAPEYLALNANGTVPLLIDGDFILDQNAAILCYVAELHPHAQLLGDGSARSRAEVMRWLSFLNSDLHPAFKPIFTPARFHPDPEVAEALGATARGNVRKYLMHLEARLEGREWLTDARSIADPYLFVMLRWTIRLRIGLDGFDRLSRFLERMNADPGVRAAILSEESDVPESPR